MREPQGWPALKDILFTQARSPAGYRDCSQAEKGPHPKLNTEVLEWALLQLLHSRVSSASAHKASCLSQAITEAGQDAMSG
jgi:hypothetical protein